MSWNSRGLHEVDKRLRIRNLVRAWRADLVALQENKLEQISRSTMHVCGIVNTLTGISWILGGLWATLS